MAISSALRLKGSEFNWPLLRLRIMIGWRDIESIGAGGAGQVASSTSFPTATISGKAANVAANSLHGIAGGHSHRRLSTHHTHRDVTGVVCFFNPPRKKQLELKGFGGQVIVQKQIQTTTIPDQRTPKFPLSSQWWLTKINLEKHTFIEIVGVDVPLQIPEAFSKWKAYNFKSPHLPADFQR